MGSCKNMAAISRTLVRVSRLSSQLRLFSTSVSSYNSEGKQIDVETHTGQVWESDDFRRQRFLDKTKHINQQFAIDLIAEDPIVVVDARNVWSNSGGSLGHPKVYINLDKNEVQSCGYSGRKFIQTKFYDEKVHGPSVTYEEYLEEMRPKSRD